jgi:hypothetical protein
LLTVNNVFLAAAMLAVTMLIIYYWRELRRLRRWFRKRVLKKDKKRPG